MLADSLAALFSDAAPKKLLADLAGVSHTALPTFALTTTSLRHLPKWFDRLADIAARRIRGHGNFVSDPASIGLIDATSSPPSLTAVGRTFLGKRGALYGDPARGEYELIRLLYFDRAQHTPTVRAVLQGKRGHMMKMLQQFVPTPNAGIFLSHPSLLVIAELIAQFPGAVTRLAQMPEQELVELGTLGEPRMKALARDSHAPAGLDRLCKRISGDFTRAQERRLHFVVSMCLLTIIGRLSAFEQVKLEIPYPFSNLISALDLYRLYAQYTRDVSIWFDGTQFLISTSRNFEENISRSAAPVKVLAFKPQTAVPSGSGRMSSNTTAQAARRTKRPLVTILIDQALSERAEDFVERAIVEPKFGKKFVRVGHRSREVLALADGMVPGADFYSVSSTGTPEHFLEVKSVVVDPPCDVTLTRAEYLRAVRCATEEIPYWLILVNTTTWRWWVIEDFAREMKGAALENVLQFGIRVG